ncbi:MAG TPA: alkaline phosphatase family protein, partial [Myxococcota bacterium]|nr:alkaline phosphatase family protein [Myxococcota bacterium]
QFVQGGRLDPTSGGAADVVDVYAVGDGHALSLEATVDVGGYAVGTALSADGATLWVGLQDTRAVAEVDVASASVRRTLPVTVAPWDLALTSRGELVIADLTEDHLDVLDLATGRVEPVAIPYQAGAVVASADGAWAWAVVSRGDEVVRVDLAAREVVGRGDVTDSWLDPDGLPRPNGNANGLWLDEAGDRLFVTRGADNALSVLRASDLELLGEVPTGAYPTDVELTPDGRRLVVSEGKGQGAGPSAGESAKQALDGSASIVDLGELDLAATSADVARQYARPVDLFDFECPGPFPVPTSPVYRSPIAHVVLVVKENKTFDCLLGDLDPTTASVDPTLVRWGAEITPNLHALARDFALSDNFFTQVQESDNGHLFLTNGHLTEYSERGYLEQSQTESFALIGVSAPSMPRMGNFFTHLIDHDRSMRLFGEIVGMTATSASGRTPAEFTDSAYPGGPFFNTGVKDVEKAARVLQVLRDEGVPQFVYVSLPNDHTVGTSPGRLTPESMVADNDLALGQLVEGLAATPEWASTVVIVVEDDPQGCFDHVDAHRSPLLVIGPWARRGYVSHAQASFLSIFATMERILGLPPMGRQDASAAPLYDMFVDEADLSGWGALPRTFPDALTPPDGVGGRVSAGMDFHAPDLNPALGSVLDAWRLHRMGRLDRAEAERRVGHILVDPELWEELEDEAAEERSAFDEELRRYREWECLRR